jgi:hypothetical protein
MAKQDVAKGNIAFKSLFHQIMQRDAQKNHDTSLYFQIIRSERFKPCLEKVKEGFEPKNTDAIIFQIRGDHYLRILKFFGVYKDKNTSKHKFTFNFLKWAESKYETHYLPDSRPLQGSNENRSLKTKITSIIKWVFHRTNYSFGFIIGNEKKAFENYIKVIEEMVALANKHAIPIIFLGVTSRPNIGIEEFFARRLNTKMVDYFSKNPYPYLNIFGSTTQEGDHKFCDKIIFSLNENGHKEIAQNLSPLLLKVMETKDTEKGLEIII